MFHYIILLKKLVAGLHHHNENVTGLDWDWASWQQGLLEIRKEWTHCKVELVNRFSQAPPSII